MIEGGAELAGSVLAGGVVDELHAFIAPILLGPRGRPGAVDWAGPATPAEAPCIVDPQWEVCGVDAHVWGTLRYPAAEPRVDSWARCPSSRSRPPVDSLRRPQD